MDTIVSEADTTINDVSMQLAANKTFITNGTITKNKYTWYTEYINNSSNKLFLSSAYLASYSDYDCRNLRVNFGKLDLLFKTSIYNTVNLNGLAWSVTFKRIFTGLTSFSLWSALTYLSYYAQLRFFFLYMIFFQQNLLLMLFILIEST